MTGWHQNWQGFLSFTLEDRFGKTVVKDKRHFGPLVLQRPYYQEDQRPTILVIHPPGGLVAGDELRTHITLKPHAKALISTPAATKFYRSLGARAYQLQQIILGKHTQLEWLPQEALFFNQCRVHNHLYFQLQDADCALIAWDLVGLGRPAMQETFAEGELLQKVQISLEDQPLFIDRFYFNQTPELLHSPLGLNGQILMAMMLFYHPQVTRLQQVKEALLQQSWRKPCAVSLVDKVLVLRTLDSDLEDIKARLIGAWQIARPIVIEAEPIMPRIWKT